MLKQIAAATGDQHAALSVVGLTELVHGVYRVQTVDARNRRDAFVREMFNDVPVYPFSRETALLAGKIDAAERGRGVVIPFADLLIGATALELGYSTLTVNVRHFRADPWSCSHASVIFWPVRQGLAEIPQTCH